MSDKPKPADAPDLKVLSAHFTAHNYLPMSFHINRPKIETAMEIAANATALFYEDRLKTLRDEIRELKKTGVKNQ